MWVRVPPRGPQEAWQSWSIAADLKSAGWKRSVGSNPTASSKKINGDAATTAVLRQTVNLFRKVNIVGSNPTGTTKINTQVAKLAEATDLESVQCEFESHFWYHILNII